MLEAKGISVRYGRRAALLNVSFKLCGGEFLAVLGANGAGKSTLLSVLSGSLKPSAGAVFYDGKSIENFSARHLADRRAVLEQECSAEFDFSVFDVVQLGIVVRAPLLGAPKSLSSAVGICLAKVGLANFEDRRYNSLSSGEKRRVQLARVLCQLEDGENIEKKILFLDEPSAGLDPSHALLAMRAADDCRRRGAICVAAVHDPNLAFAFATKCALLKGGEIFALGETRETLTARNISQIYNADCEILETARGAFAVFPK